MISVVTDEMVSQWKELYAFFSDLSIRYVDFLPCYNPDSSIFLSPAGFEAFYLPLLNAWLTDDPKTRPDIRLFSDFVKRIRSEPGGALGCEVMGQCGEIQYITEIGDLYPCTVLPIIDDLKMGNIVTDSFDTVLSSDNYMSFQRKHNGSSLCNTCSYLDICRGGCAARRIYPPEPQTGRETDTYCRGRKMIIDSIKSHLKGDCK